MDWDAFLAAERKRWEYAQKVAADLRRLEEEYGPDNEPDMEEPTMPIADSLLQEAAMGWEPGPGPFTVELKTVNRIINYLHGFPPEVK